MTSVWAFDIGKASLGESVRVGNQLVHSESWLIPEDFARRGPSTSPGSPANRYRAWRTREAHLARERRLREVLAEAGVEVLKPKQVRRTDSGWEVVHAGDERLTREFPAKGDNTCYTSCLLRIKLLRGEKLEGWQIHKALHSAIQRRGYDANVPWRRKADRKVDPSEVKEEGETKQRVVAYQDRLNEMAPGRLEFHFPCYFEAWRLGLWHADRPTELRLRIDHKTEPARNRDGSGIPAVVAPRDLVIAEVRALIESASRQFPKLVGQADYILHGPGLAPYASHDPVLRKVHGLREGGSSDWLGILGQKVPRFDNRIIAKCALIPRLNVCKASQARPGQKHYHESLLPAEVTFLLKLKNVMVQRSDKHVGKLTNQEIRSIFEDPKRELTELSFKKTKWKRICLSFGARPAPGHEEIKAPKASGRSRFCRPALKILRRLVLSGESPRVAYERELAAIGGNTDPGKGLVADDLEFMRRMGDSWEDTYVPDQQHEALTRLRKKEGRDAAIKALIGSVNDPIVRNRLEIFWKRLVELESTFGVPGDVVLEFVRDDFLGDDAKRDLQKFQKQREDDRLKAREAAEKLGATGRAAGLKFELLEQQGGICLYTGQPLGQTQLDELEIEHIVPRSSGGPDAVINYVVTTRAINDAKGDRTPYEWFAAQDFNGWDAYVSRVESRVTFLRRKKVRLLTSPDAAELVSRYTALAETAWIARLAQTLVALYFNWPINSQTGERHITIVSGGLTARVRRLYRLNSLLHEPCPSGVDSLEWEEQCDKKNRKDKRHHALDAMLLSFIPGWARDKRKAGFFRLPEGVTRDTFAEAISKVIPRNLAFEKSSLEATIFGQRVLADRHYGVSRKTLSSLAVNESIGGKRTIVSADKIDTSIVVDPAIRQEVTAFLAENPNLTLPVWDEWCASYRRGGVNGPRVKKVLITVTKPDVLDEYRDLSKDGSGQWRRGARHKGYFVVDVAAPTKKKPDKRTLRVYPVYAHRSLQQARVEMPPDKTLRVLGYFESGCLIQIDTGIDHKKIRLPAGRYRLTTIKKKGDIFVRNHTGEKMGPIGLSKFIAAGFRRVE